MKLCKDCRHAQRDLIGWLSGTWRWARCELVVTRFDPDPVTGKTERPLPQYCSIVRNPRNRCGPTAELFEAK